MKESNWNFAIENAPRNGHFLVLFPDKTWDKAKFYFDGHGTPCEGNWYIDGIVVYPIAYQEIIISEEDKKIIDQYNSQTSYNW